MLVRTVMHYVLSITVAVVALCSNTYNSFTRVEMFHTQTISIRVSIVLHYANTADMNVHVCTP